jgi:hypothetical protein
MATLRRVLAAIAENLAGDEVGERSSAPAA